MSKANGVPFRRVYDPDESTEGDPVNVAITMGTACVYGIAQTAVAVLGMSSGLGFVHQGTQRSFVYDIADLYKADLVLPFAFRLSRSENPRAEMVRHLRKDMKLVRLMRTIVSDVQRLFEGVDGADSVGVDGSLWDPEVGAVPSGLNWGE